MKTNNALLLLAITALLSTACSTKISTVKTKPGHIPPGQAKKMTGSQSAKPYAPGQQKKG